MNLKSALTVLLLASVAGSPGLAAGQDLDSIRQLSEAGAAEAALVKIDEVLAADPDDPDAAFLKAQLLAESGRRQEAKQVLLDLSQRFPDRPEPYNNLAVIYAEEGAFEQAVQVLKLALQTHPSYRVAYDNLTQVYGELASQAYNRALGQEPPDRDEPLELALLQELTPMASGGTRVQETVTRTVVAAVETEPGAGKTVVEAPLPKREVTAAASQPTPAAAVQEAARQEARSTSSPRVEPGEVAVAPPAAPGVAVGADVATVASSVGATAEAWARAWAEQRVEDYLAFYSPDFRPAGDRTRSDWEALRRARISAPDWIEISIALLGVDPAGPDRATIRFLQSYQSSGFSDAVTKALEMVHEGGSWKIVEERVEE